ncbi:MAG: CapA family protein [Bryobacteraceae bacterium]|nr:CapA family protein [Bryobacteraceae bacterium]MDW8377324.1 CapA family protein [Bryobacterales bacterium]
MFGPLLLALLLVQGWAEATDPPVNRLLFGGDVMLSRTVYRTAQQRQDPAYPFRKIAGAFSAADLAFVNLESPFAATGPYFDLRMVFRAHPSMLEGLKLAGIDVVSTANNHARDAGSQGVEFTLELLERNGIQAVGTARTPEEAYGGVVVERKGIRFGFLAYTEDQRNGNHADTDPRIAMLDETALRTGIESLRRRCDVVIVSMHAGWEYSKKPNRLQTRMARLAVDSGASIVVGHHPHVPQPVEPYKKGVIFYSLGNLVFDQEHLKADEQGVIGEVIFFGRAMVDFQVHRIQINHTAPEFLPAIRARR